MPGGDLIARARHRHGRGRPRDPGRVAQVGGARAAADRPRGPLGRRRQPRPHLPQVPRRPARVRRRGPAHARGRDRDDGGPAQRARRPRAADRRDRGGGARGPSRWRSTTCTRWSRGRIRTPSSAGPSSRTCSTCSTAATRARSSRSCDRGSCGIASRARSGRGKGARQLAVTNAGTIPDRGLYSVTLPDGRRVGELDEEMVYEARPGQTFLLGASTWRIEEIGRDRVIVTPAPGLPGAVPFWKGDGVGRPKELGEAIGAFSRWAVEQPAEVLEREYDLDGRAANNLVEFLREQQSGHARGPVGPSDRGRALPRRDRRLAAVRPEPVRRTRPRGLGPGAERADPRPARARVRRDLVRRRDHRPPARRRGAAGRRPRDARARRGRGRGRRRAVRERPVRRALPRERRSRAADPAGAAGPANAAVAAAAEVPVAARGREEVRRVPDHPRDLPRVPARRARRPRAGRAADRAAPPRADAGRGRDRDRVAVRVLAAVRLRRDVHVRGRHAERRAPRRGAVARPRSAARAARAGGAARPDRPGRAWTRSRTTSSSAPRSGGPPAATACTTCSAASGT